MMRDQASRLSAVQVFGPVSLDADNTPAALDLNGYNSATLYISVGAGGITFSTTNKVEFKLTHSDDDSTYTAVEQADVIGPTVASGGIVRSLVAAKAAADTAPTEVGYIGGKRYLKLLADFSGTHGAATPMSAVLVRGNSIYKPV
jgi:hypothetical protein